MARSRFPDGSSARMTEGPFASALATATPLLLAAGELARPVRRAVVETDALEASLGARSAASWLVAPAMRQRHHDVLERRELPQQVVELEDEADGPVPEGGHRLVRTSRRRRSRRT